MLELRGSIPGGDFPFRYCMMIVKKKKKKKKKKTCKCRQNGIDRLLNLPSSPLIE